MRPVQSLVVLLVASTLLACVGPGAGTAPTETRTVEEPVIYGDDDRLDWYAHPDGKLRDLTANAIVAMMGDRTLDMDDPDDVRIRGRSLGEAYELCPDQRFADQPTGASCSGTLIDDDLVLTAGHCVSGSCSGTSWVFNYYYESEDNLQTITSDDVFDCEDIVVQSGDGGGWGGGGGGADYAIVRLDRPATPRYEPVEFNFEQYPVSIGDPLAMIGFGSGLPAKIDDGGVVQSAPTNSRSTAFTGTVDAFGGNSGSGVFDDEYRVVGILVSGETDYDFRGGCARVAQLPDDGGPRGSESMTYAFLALQDLCEGGYPSERLCGIAPECGDGICSVGEDIEGCPDDCDGLGAPSGWACDPDFYGARDGCDCDCGIFDPDCDDQNQELFNCRYGEYCDEDGACVEDDHSVVEPEIPDMWSCPEEFYDAADGCDCDCGSFDPDCDDPVQEVLNCETDEYCTSAGVCATGDDPTDPIAPDPADPADPAGPEPIGDEEIDTGDGFAFGDIIEGLGGGGGGGDTGCSTTGRPAPPVAVMALGLVALLRRRR